MSKVDQIVAARHQGNWVVLETRHGLAADIADDLWYGGYTKRWCIARVRADGQLDVLAEDNFQGVNKQHPLDFAKALVAKAGV